MRTPEKRSVKSKNQLRTVCTGAFADESETYSTFLFSVQQNPEILYNHSFLTKSFNTSFQQINIRNYNSARWKITSPAGSQIESGDLTLPVNKNTRKPLFCYKQNISVPPYEKILPDMQGALVTSNTVEFQGADFNIIVD